MCSGYYDGEASGMSTPVYSNNYRLINNSQGFNWTRLYLILACCNKTLYACTCMALHGLPFHSFSPDSAVCPLQTGGALKFDMAKAIKFLSSKTLPYNY